MISHKYKCIFIHIPKTAGSSIEKKLGLYNEIKDGVQDHRTIRAIRPLSLRRHGRYLIDSESIRQEWMSRKEMFCNMLGFSSRNNDRATSAQFKNYLKFTVVRNPWDRVYSWYRNVMHDRRHGIPECNFSTFVNEYGDSWALRSQLYWIRDYDGSIPLDFIARYERLEIDVSDILQRLGFDDVALPHLLNSGADGASVKNAGRDYRVVYDATTRAAIAERYCEEIELFGYNF